MTTKIVVSMVGCAVLVAGLVMLVTPGPGLVGIAAGLAILATEWDWAEKVLQRVRRKLEDAQRAAAEMDPARRRKRILLTGSGSALVVGGGAAFVAVQGWPGWTVVSWNRAQSFLGFLPELPGM